MKALSQDIGTTIPEGRLFFHMLAAIAEFEHDLTVQQIAETFGVSRPTIYRHLAEHVESVVERWASRTARKHGFTSVSHTVELLGISANCAGNTKA